MTEAVVQNPIAVASKGQAILREAVLSGKVTNALGDFRSLLEKIQGLLGYAETGTDVATNIAELIRKDLEMGMGKVSNAPGQDAPGEGTVPGASYASSFQLMWSLLQTPEFQQFLARMIAQLLQGKTGMTNPPPAAPRPPLPEEDTSSAISPAATTSDTKPEGTESPGVESNLEKKDSR